MRIVETQQQMSSIPKGAVLTIGNFDGVHRGHQAILSTARRLAREKGLAFAVMTFDPHPAVVLHPEQVLGILTPLPIKTLLFEAMSVDILIVIKDSMALMNLSPEDFVDQFLMKNLAPSAVVEGPDFNFGYGRSGSIHTLRELSASRGFEVVEVPFAEFFTENDRRGVKCSSTTIRHLLEAGDVWQASQILGRPYRLVGKTIAGRGIGRQLGFPTANIDPIKQVIPAEGVYAGYAVVGDSLEEVAFGGLRRPAAVSIGRAKTFVSDHPLLLEAHFLEDKVEDLKGKWLALDFMRFIRHQQRFETHQLLQRQIAKDCQKALNFLL
ncbi:MAG: bifunctional riboflavin kinase/FAD synthetase [Phycisphaerae bacterium]|nr:bifunctional riboflavin kinase/FAD synthetase [Phycisphaerae bacterium]